MALDELNFGLRSKSMTRWGTCCLGVSAMLAFFGPSAIAQAQSDPDARARATEAQMTDAERFQLLRGIIPIPLPNLAVTVDPKELEGIPAITGFVRGIPRLGIPDLRGRSGFLRTAPHPQQGERASPVQHPRTRRTPG